MPWSECSRCSPCEDSTLAQGLSQMVSLLRQPGFGGVADASSALGDNASLGFLQRWGQPRELPQVAQDWIEQNEKKKIEEILFS